MNDEQINERLKKLLRELDDFRADLEGEKDAMEEAESWDESEANEDRKCMLGETIDALKNAENELEYVVRYVR